MPFVWSAPLLTRRGPFCGARLPRRDAGVVERGGLENRCARERTQGSNPCLSATQSIELVST